MINKYRIVIALSVYILFAFLLYPLYKNILHFDMLAYLPLIRRWAEGDLHYAVNGYWSPLQCWLAVPLYKAGLSAFAAFQIAGLLGGAGVLVMINYLLRKVNISTQLKAITLFTCIPAIQSYAFYFQTPDLLVCLPLLMYIDIITEKDFFENKTKNVLCGVIGCCCYFAKTYAFPFFLVHFTLVQIICYRNAANKDRTSLLIRNLVLGLSFFLLPAIPWIYALYNKYHMVTYGYSGKLNFQWQLYPIQYDPGKLRAVSPAPFNTFWEDPYFQPWKYTPHAPYFSLPVIKKQIHLLLSNTRNMFSGWASFSVLSGAIIGSLAIYAIQTRQIMYKLILLTIVLLPLGYLLVAIETRYMVLINFLILITGPLLVSKALQAGNIPKKLQTVCWCIFFGSFLFNPLHMLKNAIVRNNPLYTYSKELKAKGVHGKIAANFFADYGEISRLVFLMDDTLHQFTRIPKNPEEELAACREAGIDYYFYNYYYPNDAQTFKNTVLYKSAVQEIKTLNDKLIVLKLN